MSHVQCLLTTGESGCGKSFIRCPLFLLNEFLPEAEGVHLSNFPLGEVPESNPVPPRHEGETFADRIAAEAARRARMRSWFGRLLHRTGKPQDVDAYRKRIQTIPVDALQRMKVDYKDGGLSPLMFFGDKDITGHHIAIDEAHNFVGKHHSKEHVAEWQALVGELRHRGARIEFITQALGKLNPAIIDESGLRIGISSAATDRDPIFGITAGDWYELRAAFTGSYVGGVYEVESRQGADGKWKETRKRCWSRDPFYFQFYDSHSAPEKGGAAATGREKLQWERRTKLGLLAWFIARNGGSLAWRAALMGGLLWFGLGGYRHVGAGMTWAVHSAIGGRRDEEPGDAPSESEPSEVASSPSSDRPTVFERPEEAPPAWLAQEVRRLRGELGERVEEGRRIERAERRAASMQAATERLREFVAAQYADEDGVGGVTENEVLFRDGRVYAVGERIGEGSLSGATIEAIDYATRAVRLDDGRVLHLRGVERVPATPELDDGAGADVRGRLPAFAGRPRLGGTPSGGDFATGDNGGPRSPTDRGGGVPDETNGALDRGR